MGFSSNAAPLGVKAGEGRTQNPLELPLLEQAYGRKINSEIKLYCCDVPPEMFSALNWLKESM